MAYDQGLSQRIREMLEEEPGLTEKEMFGGIAFMVNGNVACGVMGDELMVRIGKEGADELLQEPGARTFDFTGRPMKGWLMVNQEGYDPDAGLEIWVERGVRFARSLPQK